MNCKLLSVAVFLTLMLTSLLAGRHNYCKARNEITADLNQALAQRYNQGVQTTSQDFRRTGTDCCFR